MAGSRKRSTVLAAAVAGLFAVGGAVANAAPTNLTYRGAWSKPFSTQASCAAASAINNDPPDVLTQACAYYAIDPRGPYSNGTPGWYYYYRYEID